MKTNVMLIRKFTFYLCLVFFEIIGLSSIKAAEFSHENYKPNTKMVADKQLVDVVPDRFLLSQGILETEIYVANTPSLYPKVSTNIFHGLLSLIQSLSNAAFLGILMAFTVFLLSSCGNLMQELKN